MFSFIKTTVWLSMLSLFPVATATETTPTTILPTTTVPPGSCEQNGVLYQNGAVIEKDPYNCYGTNCVDGSVQYWDGECMFRTPVCYGWTEKVLGQCCPVCHDNKTTVPTTTPETTTPLLRGCLYNGKIYENGASIETDPNNCYGLYCDRGNLIAWDGECAFHIPYCAGWTEKIPGQCCPVCHNVTTTSPKTPPSTPTDGCLVDGKVYANGQRTNSDPCYLCSCTVDGTEKCSNITCNTVLDCEIKYKPVGDCCFTCGSSQMTINLLLVPFLLLICKWNKDF